MRLYYKKGGKVSKDSMACNKPKRRKSFRARHKCDSKPPSKMSARYWSCKNW